MTAARPETRQLIAEFLNCRRIAVVGASRNPQDFGTASFREFLQRGYDAVPVNPNAAEIEGRPCYARVQDINPAAEAALLLTPPSAATQVVRDCAEAGIRLVWMRRPGGLAALESCRQNGIRVIAGYCPHMFLPEAHWFHRFHGWLLKVAGKYPR